MTEAPGCYNLITDSFVISLSMVSGSSVEEKSQRKLLLNYYHNYCSNIKWKRNTSKLCFLEPHDKLLLFTEISSFLKFVIVKMLAK